MTLPLHYWPVLSGEPLLLPHFSAILRSGCHSAAIHGWQMVFDGMVSRCHALGLPCDYVLRLWLLDLINMG